MSPDDVMSTLVRGPVKHHTHLLVLSISVLLPPLRRQDNIVDPRSAITSKNRTGVGPILYGDEQDHSNTLVRCMVGYQVMIWFTVVWY